MVQRKVTYREEMAKIVELIEAFQASEHNALAILAKTPRQARALFRSLLASMTDVHLLDEASKAFSTGIVVCTVPLWPRGWSSTA